MHTAMYTFRGRILLRIGFVVLAMSTAGGWTVPTAFAQPQPPGADFKSQFLRLCDLASQELNKEFSPFGERTDTNPRTHHFPFFEDAHAVRALAVANDMTGKQEYLDTCRHWSDRMIAYQDQMDPKGAYYLNYFRKPGQRPTKELWFISDAGSMAMAVFATAIRCPDEADKARYLKSVEAFAKVVMADRIGRNGGIIEKLWGGWADEVVVLHRHVRRAGTTTLRSNGRGKVPKGRPGCAQVDDRSQFLRCPSDHV